MPKPIPYQRALSLVFKNLPLIGTENVKLVHLTGRVLRRPVKADRPLPPFNRSAMDGYAAKFSDFKNRRATLECVGILEAGRSWKGKIGKGETIRIMTGAPVPDGADVVVMVEHSKVSGDTVLLDEPKLVKWLNIPRMGSDTKKGNVLIGEGELLKPVHISVAASVGFDRATVSKKIKTCVIVTGTELVPVNKKPKPFQIRDSNSGHLLSRLSGFNFVDANFGGLLRDDLEYFRKTVKKAIEKNDLVIISGGVSVGDFDYTSRILSEVGVKKVFHRIAIRPGKPVWFGRAGRTVVFGLPGNPVSVAVTFHEFVLPAIKKMAGMKKPDSVSIFLPLSADISKKHALREFRVAGIEDGGSSVAVVRSYHGSGDFVSASKSDGVIVMPEEARALKAGQLVEFHPWDF